MMELRNTQTHEVRIQGDDIVGYASVFYDGSRSTEYELWPGVFERIDERAFDRAIKEKQDVRALFNHNHDALLGRVSSGTLTLKKDSRGLKYIIPFDEADEDHRRVKAKIQRGDLRGSSFGFRVTDEEWREEGGNEIRIVKDVDLIEVSACVFPAYVGTEGVREARSSRENWYLRIETEKRLRKLKALL